jgi:hypothetical protein
MSSPHVFQYPKVTPVAQGSAKPPAAPPASKPQP